MTLSRKQFYCFSLAVCLSPFILYKTGWMIISKPTTGIVFYIDKTHGRGTLEQTFPVVVFIAGKDTVTAYGDYNLPYHPGEEYPIRYNRFIKTDTRLNTFWGCWIDTIIWCTILTVVVTITFLVEGIVPKNKLVRLSLKGIEFIEESSS